MRIPSGCLVGGDRFQPPTLPANPPAVAAALAAGEERGTAFGAERLKARPAVSAGLGVDLGHLPRHPDLFARADHRDPVGRSGQRLAICAVTDRHSLWIDVGLISHRTAMALPVDIHLISTPIAAMRPIRKKETAPEGAVLSFHDP